MAKELKVVSVEGQKCTKCWKRATTADILGMSSMKRRDQQNLVRAFPDLDSAMERRFDEELNRGNET